MVAEDSVVDTPFRSTVISSEVLAPASGNVLAVPRDPGAELALGVAEEKADSSLLVGEQGTELDAELVGDEAEAVVHAVADVPEVEDDAEDLQHEGAGATVPVDDLGTKDAIPATNAHILLLSVVRTLHIWADYRP